MSDLDVLYVYDYEDWAVHNVGRLWLADSPGVRVTFVGIDDLTAEMVAAHEIVWFGYMLLCYRACAERLLRARDLARCVVGIHDPKELFPERADWQRRGIGVMPPYSRAAWARWLGFRVMRHARAVVVTSREMEAVLTARRVPVRRIPTGTLLPARAAASIVTERLDAIAVFQPSPRKNQVLLERVAVELERAGTAHLSLKVGRVVLEQDDYITLLDRHEVYVCASFQEGGPLPAMDAMARGAVVVTSPVGQMPELVVHGETGFVCGTEEEFVRRITDLAADLPRLHEMRVASLARFVAERQPAALKAAARAVLHEVAESGVGRASSWRALRRRAAFDACRWLPALVASLTAVPKALWRAAGLAPPAG